MEALRGRLVVLMAVAMALGGAACARGTTAGAGPTTTGVTPPTASPSTSPAGSGGNLYGAGGRYGGGSSTSVSAGTLKQGAGGFVFSPARLTVTSGDTITITNVGIAAHTFTATGKGIDVVNAPGQSKKVTINLPAGTYAFVCRFHATLGMKGTLVVKG